MWSVNLLLLIIFVLSIVYIVANCLILFSLFVLLFLINSLFIEFAFIGCSVILCILNSIDLSISITLIKFCVNLGFISTIKSVSSKFNYQFLTFCSNCSTLIFILKTIDVILPAQAVWLVRLDVLDCSICYITINSFSMFMIFYCTQK